jgi:hypothetical protein
MHSLITFPTTRAITLLDADAPSANDSAAYARPKWQVADVNVLVSNVVGHVAARAQPANVCIELALAPGRPVIMGDPTELAFAVSGVLGAEVRGIDAEAGGTVTVELDTDARTVTVVMTSDELPPLSCVRALGPTEPGQDVDPTVAHCRRIVEAQGGRLELVARDGRIGFAIQFRRLPLSTGIRVLPFGRARTAFTQHASRRAAS